MAEKTPQEIFKTEEQLKAEAKARQEAEQKQAAEAAPKTDRQKKWENYWYHYKWQTVAAAFLVMLLVMYIRDVFQPRPDITLIMIGKGYVAPETVEAFADMLEPVAGDFDDDGHSIVNVDSITLPSSEEGMGGELEYASSMKIVTVVAANADPVYVLDDAAFAYLTGMGGEDNSSSVFDQMSVPMPADIAAALPELADYRFYLRDKEGVTKTEYYYWCYDLLKKLQG